MLMYDIKTGLFSLLIFYKIITNHNIEIERAFRDC